MKCYRESKGGELCLFAPVLLAKAGELIEESCIGQIPNSDGMTQNETQKIFLWNLRIFRKALSNPHTFHPSASLLKTNHCLYPFLLFSQSFSLLFPRLASCLLTRRNTLPPQMCRTIPDSLNTSRSKSAICSPGHTHANAHTALLTGFQAAFIQHIRLWTLWMGKLCMGESGTQRICFLSLGQLHTSLLCTVLPL